MGAEKGDLELNLSGSISMFYSSSKDWRGRVFILRYHRKEFQAAECIMHIISVFLPKLRIIEMCYSSLTAHCMPHI